MIPCPYMKEDNFLDNIIITCINNVNPLNQNKPYFGCLGEGLEMEKEYVDNVCKDNFKECDFYRIAIKKIEDNLENSIEDK